MRLQICHVVATNYSKPILNIQPVSIDITFPISQAIRFDEQQIPFGKMNVTNLHDTDLNEFRKCI